MSRQEDRWDTTVTAWADAATDLAAALRAAPRAGPELGPDIREMTGWMTRLAGKVRALERAEGRPPLRLVSPHGT